MEELAVFLDQTRDAREYKRGLAVKLALRGYSYAEISDMLGVSEPFISKWRGIFAGAGSDGLKMGYSGSHGYLDAAARQAIKEWLKQQEAWNLLELQVHIEEQYGVVFKSLQSYYDIFDAAQLSWKKSQKVNPKKDAAAVEAKKKKSART